MSRPRAWCELDLCAVRHNLAVVRHRLPDDTGVIAVVKANAYGHGMVEAARALEGPADALAVATMDEAVTLRDAGLAGPLLVLQGASCAGDLDEAAARGLWLMVHEQGQLERLLRQRGRPLAAWLKIDTGMHRLGFLPADAAAALDSLLASGAVAASLAFALSDNAAFWVFFAWSCSVFALAGFTIGNLNALALEPLGHIAGMAASV